MIEIITIGDELLMGSTADENARYLAESVTEVGAGVTRAITVGDRPEDIQKALKNVFPQTRYVIITGGLGPTEDDRTAEAAAAAFCQKLMLNDDALQALREKLGRYGRGVSETNKKQAVLPERSKIIPNPSGTACGFLISENGQHFAFLPGVPGEVRTITETFLKPDIKNILSSSQVILSRTLKVFGLWESAIQERLCESLPSIPGLALGYYPKYPEVRLKITGRGNKREDVQRDVNDFARAIHNSIGEYIYADRDIELEEVVGQQLTKQAATLAVAESCTGGLITHRLTNVPGSSAYLDRSFIVYSNKAKEELLNVPRKMLDQFGAVSEPVAGFMAESARRLSSTSYSLSITGIAGPGGGCQEKPVGTVFIGIASEHRTRVNHYHLHGNRHRIKTMTSQIALDNLRKIIMEKTTD